MKKNRAEDALTCHVSVSGDDASQKRETLLFYCNQVNNILVKPSIEHSVLRADLYTIKREWKHWSAVLYLEILPVGV